MAPDCQFQYGSGCDSNKWPQGKSTSTIPRPLTSVDIPYGGEGIWQCTVPGTVALTFDDGPWWFTSGVLDVLKEYNAKATFFLSGNNIGKGEMDLELNGWPAFVRRMYAEGHQIGSHTWSHQDLSTLNANDLDAELVKNEIAISNVLGFFPQYMRPPYSNCASGTDCDKAMVSRGYHEVYYDIDTEDYMNDTPERIQRSKDIFDNYVKTSNPAKDRFLVIAHDIHEQTAQNLTRYMLQTMNTTGYQGVTVGTCLGDPVENWYRTAA